MNSAAPRATVSLRVSITDRCQLRCVYCTPAGGVAAVERTPLLSGDEIVRFVRGAGFAFNVSKVHLTGGEPLLRRDVVAVVRQLADIGVSDIALTTNGQRLAPLARELRSAGLTRVNVSLDSLDPVIFTKLARGGELGRTLAGIDAAISAGFAPVKLNSVVLRNSNDDEVERLAGFALERGCQIRFLELMPIGCAEPFFAERFVAAAEIQQRLASSLNLTPLLEERGATSRDFIATDHLGRRGIVGFIAPQSKPFCDGCNRLRLTSTGRLIRCLAEGLGPDVRPTLQSDDPACARALGEEVARQLGAKTRRSGFVTLRSMVAVGG